MRKLSPASFLALFSQPWVLFSNTIRLIGVFTFLVERVFECLKPDDFGVRIVQMCSTTVHICVSRVVIGEPERQRTRTYNAHAIRRTIPEDHWVKFCFAVMKFLLGVLLFAACYAAAYGSDCENNLMKTCFGNYQASVHGKKGKDDMQKHCTRVKVRLRLPFFNFLLNMLRSGYRKSNSGNCLYC